jgi:hypothetical protein
MIFNLKATFLPYIRNGDITGITEQEKTLIDSFILSRYKLVKVESSDLNFCELTGGKETKLYKYFFN